MTNHVFYQLSMLTFAMVVFLPSLVVSNDSSGRLFKKGDVILGGLVRVHQQKNVDSCGKLYPPGLGRVEAMLYAIDQVNKNSSVLPRLHLGYDIRDFCQNPVLATRHGYEFAIASKMNCSSVSCSSNHQCICNGKDDLMTNYTTTYPVAAIVGALTSRAALPLANFLQAVKIPLIDSAATSEELSSPLYNSFFRTIPSDINQAKAIADIIDHYKWKYVAAIVVDDSYGRHGAKALERESRTRKTFYLDVVGYIPISEYNGKVKAIVSFLKQRKTVRVIILWSHSFQGKEMLKTASKEGLTNRVWIFSEALTMVKPEYLPLNGGLATTGVHLGVQLPKIQSDGFMKHLRAKIARNDSKELTHWWNEFWMMARLEKNCSMGCDLAAFTESALEMVHDDFVPYIIDAIHTAAHAIDRILKCMRPDGTKSDNSDCKNDLSNLHPEDMIAYIKKVRFQGVTGTVEFDQRGDPKEAFYDIVYFNITNTSTGSLKVSKQTVFQWNKGFKYRLALQKGAFIQWKTDDGQVPVSICTEECHPGQFKALTTDFCWKCLRCPDGTRSLTFGAMNCSECKDTQRSNAERTACVELPAINVNWDDASGCILVVVSLFGLVTDIFTFFIFVHFRHTPMVKASNKVCSFVLLFGIGLCFGMVLLYIPQPVPALCYILKPLRYIVYTLCCSALFLKTMQIVHAFNVSRLKDWIWVFICSTKRQVLVLVLIIGIQVFLSLAWILFDPPHVHVTITPRRHVFVACESFKDVAGQILEHLMLIYLISMAGLCTYYAYRARNLPANFNEAKYICFSLYIFLVSWITYYPIDYALEGWYVAVLSGATILLSSYGILGCIFVPKLYIIIRHPEKNTAEFLRAEIRQSTINRSVNNVSSGGGSAGSPV